MTPADDCPIGSEITSVGMEWAMKVLVLGADGMLGHKLMQRLAGSVEATGTLRAARPDAAVVDALPGARIIGGVDASSIASVAAAMETASPTVVVNGIGIVKQRRDARDPAASIQVNALFPHLLATLCAERGARLVHFSTDCVFSGRDGPYREDDASDAEDLYGRTKYLGEVTGQGCLTLRSSIIGHALRGQFGLIDWFVAQRGGQVNGFAGALYTGLPTVVMADLVVRILTEWPHLEGLCQVASAPISKYDLLRLVDRIYRLGIRVDRDDAFRCDRRLDGSRLRGCIGWSPPPWEDMVVRMLSDAEETESGWQPQSPVPGQRR